MIEKSKYSLAGQYPTASNQFGIKGIRQISAQEFARFDTAIEEIVDFTINHALFEICETNYRKLIVNYERIKNEFKILHKMDETISDRILNETNRLLMNYLSSFKTMIDHFQTRYTRLDRTGTQYLCAFKTTIEGVYDASFAYRFFSKLRNYVQHYGPPLGGIDAEVHESEGGEIVAQLFVYFDRDALLSKFNKWGKVKKELEFQPNQIEISFHLLAFHLKVQELFNTFSHNELEIVKDARIYLSNLVSEVHSQIPDARPLLVDFSGLSASGGRLQKLVIPIRELDLIRVVENAIHQEHKK